MNAWLLSIVGVVSLGVLLEILLADGETAKYIKGVFALAVVLILVAPLPKFLNKDFDLNDFFGKEMQTQTTFLNSVNERKNQERENRILTELKKSEIDVQKVRIFYLRGDTDNIDVVKVYVKGDFDKDKICKIVVDNLACKQDKIKIYNGWKYYNKKYHCFENNFHKGGGMWKIKISLTNAGKRQKKLIKFWKIKNFK